jgi:hypothetical protein
MPKIGKNNRISIPPEILTLRGWKSGTEIIFVPEKDKTDGKLTKETPIVLAEVLKEKKK